MRLQTNMRGGIDIEMPAHTILCGSSFSGKTNIINALSLLFFGYARDIGGRTSESPIKAHSVLSGLHDGEAPITAQLDIGSSELIYASAPKVTRRYNDSAFTNPIDILAEYRGIFGVSEDSRLVYWGKYFGCAQVAVFSVKKKLLAATKKKVAAYEAADAVGTLQPIHLHQYTKLKAACIEVQTALTDARNKLRTAVSTELHTMKWRYRLCGISLRVNVESLKVELISDKITARGVSCSSDPSGTEALVAYLILAAYNRNNQGRISVVLFPDKLIDGHVLTVLHAFCAEHFDYSVAQTTLGGARVADHQMLYI